MTETETKSTARQNGNTNVNPFPPPAGTSRAKPKERLQYLAAGTEETATEQGTGYGTVTNGAGG